MNRIAIVGGFTEGNSLLEPVAEAACDPELGLANEADIFLFREVMDNPDDLISASRGQTVLTHSAGLLGVTNECRPSKLEAYNGPETTAVHKLIMGALTKPFNRRIFVGNAAELILNFPAYMKHLGAIAAFSTMQTLEAIHEQGETNVLGVFMESDRLCRPDLPAIASAQARGMNLTLMPGGHDDLLIDPRRVLSGPPRVAA